jgi:hypothetical protein
MAVEAFVQEHSRGPQIDEVKGIAAKEKADFR